ncbi:MAG: hypothetical protein HUU35_19535, partial [Armatimonadetes bacterium]|nr:hypothetical protein [Armatimonadota bacterium]
VQALKLRGLAYRVALGEAGLQAEWYAASRRYEKLTPGRRGELLSPFSYLSLWRLVTARLADDEELARQEERYLAGRPAETEIRRR